MKKKTSGFERYETGGITCLRVNALEEAGNVLTAFSTRRGGISIDPYASLNLGFGLDCRDNVLKNRQLFFAALGVDTQNVVSCAQVHGDQIAIVDEHDRGSGVQHPDSELSLVDGMLTNRPNIALVTFYGDCVPLYFFDPRKQAVALVHAGWRGTMARIGQKAIKQMSQYFGTDPSDLYAAIGPAIGSCCFQVDQKLAFQFAAEYSPQHIEENPGGYYLDLKKLNLESLLGGGVFAENVFIAEDCTACTPEYYFSHRASSGNTGRMAAVIMLRE